MKCRQCGIEIADKAIVCYRCGTATTEPVFAPPSATRRGSKAALVTSLLALVLMVVAALFLTRSSPDGTPRLVTYVVAGVAVVIVVLRAYARRRS
jgi:peptidoglycan/LPS O-acetylase OafA/YrhL